jgi:uncharacterized protein YndB with AHSA1/START domain
VVWRAIREGAHLQRWFPISARVKPGAGGAIFLSWGAVCEGEAPITIWEPMTRLRWEESHEGGAVRVAVDFFIEAAGGGLTSVRVVQSGFGRGAKWDDLYDSIANGWKFELRSLRHYLSRHRDVDRRCEYLPVPSRLTVAEAWRAIAPAGTLVRGGGLEGHAEGAEYSFIGPDGHKYSGQVMRCVADKTFAATVRELDDAILRIEIERMGRDEQGKGCTPFVWLSVWGEGSDRVPVIAAEWKNAMARLVAG